MGLAACQSFGGTWRPHMCKHSKPMQPGGKHAHVQAVVAWQGGRGAVNGETTREWPRQAHMHEVRTGSDVGA